MRWYGCLTLFPKNLGVKGSRSYQSTSSCKHPIAIKSSPPPIPRFTQLHRAASPISRSLTTRRLITMATRPPRRNLWQTKPESRPSDRNFMSDTDRAATITVPDGALFEIKPSPGKGLGVFARTDIKPGTQILVEQPLFVIHKKFGQLSHSVIRTALREIPRETRDAFMALRNHRANNSTYRDPLTAFLDYHMSIPPNGSQDPKVSDIHGCYPLSLLFNHSCLPNASIQIHFDSRSGDSSSHVVVMVNVTKGEEITFTYDRECGYMTKAQRSSAFHRFRIERCTCKACSYDSKSQLVSDMRRALLRGLRFLLDEGESDTASKRFGISPVVISDKSKMCQIVNGRPELTKVSQYTTLAAMLSEAEGLLGNELAAQWKTAGNAFSDIMLTLYVATPGCRGCFERDMLPIKLGLFEKCLAACAAYLPSEDPQYREVKDIVQVIKYRIWEHKMCC